MSPRKWSGFVVLGCCLQAKGREDMDKPHRAIIMLQEVLCLLKNGLTVCFERQEEDEGNEGLLLMDSVYQPVTVDSMIS